MAEKRHTVTTQQTITRYVLPPPSPYANGTLVSEWFDAISDAEIGEWIQIHPFATYNKTRHLINYVSQWNTSGAWGAGVWVTTRTRYDHKNKFYYVKLCKKQEGK